MIGFAAPALIGFADRHTLVCLSLVVGPLLRGSSSRHSNNTKKGHLLATSCVIGAGNGIGFAAPALIGFADRHTLVCLSLVVGPLLRGSSSRHSNNTKKATYWRPLVLLERAMGFGPTTSTLATRYMLLCYLFCVIFIR